MPLPALLAKPALALAAGAGLLLGGALAGYFYRGSQVPGEIALARAALTKAEVECREGTACAAAADRRVVETAAAVDAARLAAEAIAAEQLAALKAEKRAALAAARAAAARDRTALERAFVRSREAVASSQECAAWSATVVPCPLALPPSP